MKHLLLILITVSCFSCLSVKVDSEKNMTNNTNNSNSVERVPLHDPKDTSMYPAPKDGYVQHIITLDEKQNEDDLKLEVFVGKIMNVDCNNHNLTGSFNKSFVNGWGYSYWEFISDGKVMSSLMACLEDTKREVFVHGEKAMVRYNSKLPLVIYTPKAYDVRYNIWEKSNTTYSTER